MGQESGFETRPFSSQLPISERQTNRLECVNPMTEVSQCQDRKFDVMLSPVHADSRLARWLSQLRIDGGHMAKKAKKAKKTTAKKAKKKK